MYIINPDFFFLPLLRGKKMPIDALQKYFLSYISLAQRGVISEEATHAPPPHNFDHKKCPVFKEGGQMVGGTE